uniref:hypothetical protein n=1 Tax=Yoonia sp. TaxID=2212373 RepID=UPI0040475F61
MTLRIFTCTSCGHKMRASGARCGACFVPKQTYQRIPVLILAGIGLFIALGVILTA